MDKSFADYVARLDDIEHDIETLGERVTGAEVDVAKSHESVTGLAKDQSRTHTAVMQLALEMRSSNKAILEAVRALAVDVRQIAAKGSSNGHDPEGL